MGTKTRANVHVFINKGSDSCEVFFSNKNQLVSVKLSLLCFLNQLVNLKNKIIAL